MKQLPGEGDSWGGTCGNRCPPLPGSKLAGPVAQAQAQAQAGPQCGSTSRRARLHDNYDMWQGYSGRLSEQIASRRVRPRSDALKTEPAPGLT